MRVCLVVLAALAATIAVSPEMAAQAVISPSQPTELTPINATSTLIFPGPCGVNVETTTVGTTIRTDVFIFSCFLGVPFPAPVSAEFGPLPAGTYTYQVYEIYEDDPPVLRSSQTIVVAAVADSIPTIGTWGLLALGALLGAGGVIMAHRGS